MKADVIGKILFFWVFILGGMFFGKALGFITDARTTIIMCVAISIVYIVFQIFRTIGKKKHAEKAEANKPPVQKGKAKHKKKRKR